MQKRSSGGGDQLSIPGKDVIKPTILKVDEKIREIFGRL